MTTTPFSTRDFLKLTAASTAALGVGTLPPSLQAADKKKIPIGLQLYSVRTRCEKDLPGTVAAVARMGYRAVEFAGYYGREAKTLRKLLDDHGLKCCGTHIGLDTLLGDNLPKTVEFNQALGNKFLIVPGLADKSTRTRQAWQETAVIRERRLSAAGECAEDCRSAQELGQVLAASRAWKPRPTGG
jgi:sugar phosphate isomerase/epimerase